MAKLTISLEDKELDEIKRRAAAEYKTVNDYIVDTIFSSKSVGTEHLLLKEVISKALSITPGEEFSLPGLYDLGAWEKINTTRKKIVGRNFRKLVKEQESGLSKEIRYLGKKSNIATYLRL